jgi:hypothetical protein
MKIVGRDLFSLTLIARHIIRAGIQAGAGVSQMDGCFEHAAWNQDGQKGENKVLYQLTCITSTD